MNSVSIRRKLTSYAFVAGLLLAYVSQAWHGYLIHDHQDHCCEEDSNSQTDSHSDDDCQLCDFVFLYDIPEKGLPILQKLSAFPVAVPFHFKEPFTLTFYLSSSLRGPPAA